jgi:hypothetical protein
MGDATGMGTGGSSGVRALASSSTRRLTCVLPYSFSVLHVQRITVQGYAESDCLGTASRNQTTLDVSFMVSATNIQQCRTSYNMTWDTTAAAVPPYVTLPLLPSHFALIA